MDTPLLHNKRVWILLAPTLIVALGTIWAYVYYAGREVHRRAALALFKEEKEYLTIYPGSRPEDSVVWLQISRGCPRQKEILQNLRYFPELESLMLWRCDLDAEDVELLTRLSPKKICFCATDITDEMLGEIGQISTLEWIALTHAHVTEKGVLLVPEGVRITGANTQVNNAALPAGRKIYPFQDEQIPSPRELVDIGVELFRRDHPLLVDQKTTGLTGDYDSRLDLLGHSDTSDGKAFYSFLKIYLCKDSDAESVRLICKKLPELTRLTTCTVAMSQDTDGDFTEAQTQYLRCLASTEVTGLLFSNIACSDRDFELLAGCRCLKRLSFSECTGDFQNLHGRYPRFAALEELLFGGTEGKEEELPEDVICRLGELNGLISLDVDNLHLSEKQIESIGKLHRLIRLALRDVELDDEDIKQIAALPNLEFLDVSENPITDQSVAVLAAMPKLRWLNISDTEISEEGRETLSQSLARRSRNQCRQP